jgi:8-oxo-dGTP diphosphatase
MRKVVAAAICRDGRLLVAQRAHPPALAGLWELPGGKVEAGEQDIAALVRECHEELGVDIAVGERVGPDVAFEDGWTLRAYAARLLGGEPQPLEHLELRWVAAAGLADLPWLPVNTVFLPALRQLLDASVS